MGWGGKRACAGRPKGAMGICGVQRKELREKFYRFALKNHKQFFESLAHTMFIEKNSKVIMWFGDQLFGRPQPLFDDPSDQQPMDFQTWIMQAYQQVDEERRLKADKSRESP